MNTDLQLAKNNLTGHTICLCRDGKILVSDRKGIAPIMGLIAGEVDIAGYSVADTVVGKAAALMFVKCGVAAVYAKTLSNGGKSVLEKYGIYFEYDVLTERILNREGTDQCPMEKTVQDTDDIEKAYVLLQEKLKSMQDNKQDNK